MIWDKARYEEAYSPPRHDPVAFPAEAGGALWWGATRFVWQAGCLVSDNSLDPATHEIICIGDGYGGLSKAFLDLGYTVITVEASDYAVSTWPEYGAPGTTPVQPPTDSHTQEGRDNVKGFSSKSTQTTGLTVTCDILGDYPDQDIGKLRDFEDYGYPVVHMVTPVSPNVSALPDNNWKTIEEWRAALDAEGLTHDVVSLAGWLRVTESLSEPKRAKETSIKSLPSSWPFEAPAISGPLGPFELNGKTYIVAKGANGPIMTYKDDATFTEIGAGPNVGDTDGYWAEAVGDGIGITYLHITAGTTTFYYALYQTSSDVWLINRQISSNSLDDDRQGTSLAQRSASLVSGFRIDDERIMGTEYSRQGVYESSNVGIDWTLVATVGEGEQLYNTMAALALGSSDAVHICRRTTSPSREKIITLNAANVLGSDHEIGMGGMADRLPWPALRGTNVNFLYRNAIGLNEMYNVSFESSDDPQTYDLQDLGGWPASGENWLGLCEADGTLYAFAGQDTNALYLTNDQALGAWTTWESVMPHGAGKGRFVTCANHAGNLGYVCQKTYDEYILAISHEATGALVSQDAILSGQATVTEQEIAATGNLIAQDALIEGRAIGGDIPAPPAFTTLIQWTLKDPEDYEQVDMTQWNETPKRPVPESGEGGGKDNDKGWVMALNVQGVKFGADHYHIKPVWDGDKRVWCCQVTQWNNDPDDWVQGDMWAEVWTFFPLSPDDSLGGQYNTRQSVVVYCAPGSFEWNRAEAENRTVLDAGEFIEPPDEEQRHGVWVTNPSFEEHQEVRTPYDWQSWMNDLPEEDQKKARELPYWGDPPMW